MTLDNPIRGKVAQILNSREVVLNIGSHEGVEPHMHFDILDAGSQDIRDPDSGEVLGSLNRPRVRVRITHVQSLLSVATTYRKTKTNIGGTGSGPYLGALSRSLLPEQWVTKHETLEAKKSGFDTLDEEDSIVKVGDLVVQVEVDDD